jgi:hypothetical protein
LKRLSWDKQTAEVLCRGRPGRRGEPEGSCVRWDVLEFLALVVDHISEPFQQMVRYWGFYANAARGKRRKDVTTQASQTSRRQDDDETQRARLSWAKLIRRVYEVDPLLCPFCGAEMKILAFILDFGATQAIRKSLEPPGSAAAGDARAERGTID